MKLLSLLVLTFAAVASAQDANDGCKPITDCNGKLELALGSTCTSSFGPQGEITASIGKVCLQCPGEGKIDLNTFPYVTCDNKALCGNVATFQLAPNQAKCILTGGDTLKCATSCTPSPAPGPSSASPSAAPTSGAPSTTSATPTSGKAPTSSGAPTTAGANPTTSTAATTAPVNGTDDATTSATPTTAAASDEPVADSPTTAQATTAPPKSGAATVAVGVGAAMSAVVAMTLAA